jgi:hypothetical protein
MEAKELRIGNYCKEITHSKNGVVKVSKRHFEDIEDNQIDLFPIPLTEEWLLKFGFSKNINKSQIDGIEMTLSIDDNKTIFSSCGKLDGGLVVLCLCAGNYFSNNLTYVHQLQNLYFALTNEELTIKL